MQPGGVRRIAVRAPTLSCYSSRDRMETRVASSSGRPDLPMAAGLSRAGWLSWFESGEQHQVVGDHGRPDVSPEVIQTAPGAAGAAVGALEPGDRRLDTGAEIAQAAVHPRAFDHVGDGDAGFLVKGDVDDPAVLGGSKIGTAGVAAVGGGLPRRRAGTGDVAVEHRQKALAVGGIAILDDDIEDQSAPARRQLQLVPVLNLTPTLENDVGVRLEQADQLLPGWHRLTVEHAALGLGDDARDQRQVIVD